MPRRSQPRTRFWANREARSSREAIFRPLDREGWGGQRCVTPRQTCPRPNGFGRNLRSKTRWFTGFCNSHQVSHFATFFIDARAEISVAESRFDISKNTQLARDAPSPGPRTSTLIRFFSLAQTAPGFVKSRRDGSRRMRGGPWRGRRSPPRECSNEFAGRSAGQVSTMILPQVHLRKPCYDFSFL